VLKPCSPPFVLLLFGDGAVHNEKEDGEKKSVVEVRRIRWGLYKFRRCTKQKMEYISNCPRSS